MEDDTFHIGKWIHIFNLVINYVYLGLLVMCFILALGNRPQGSKNAYTLAFVGFGIITIYMTVSAFYVELSADTTCNILCFCRPLHSSSHLKESKMLHMLKVGISAYRIYSRILFSVISCCRYLQRLDYISSLL